MPANHCHVSVQHDYNWKKRKQLNLFAKMQGNGDAGADSTEKAKGTGQSLWGQTARCMHTGFGLQFPERSVPLFLGWGVRGWGVVGFLLELPVVFS